MKKEVAAYIAGFLDGDGSLRVQFQPRKKTFRVRAVLSLAQKQGKERELKWIRNQFKIGFLYQRNDKMTELRVEGHEALERILKELKPFVLFKKKQVGLILEILKELKEDKIDLIKIAKLSDKISRLNYVTVEKKYTAKYIRKQLFSNTPVTTDPADSAGETS